MFEVRTENPHKGDTAAMYLHNAWEEFIVESRRTDRKAAEQDVDMLKLFGKKSWIVEIE